MNVLLAFDSFKGSLTSLEAGMAARNGLLEAMPDAQTQVLLLGDGGEGTAEALVSNRNYEEVNLKVMGPLKDYVEAKYFLYEAGIKKALINISEACGLPLVPEEFQNPMNTTTYGVGEIILDAIDKGAQELVMCLGGSSTNDCGLGMLQALGAKFEIDARIMGSICGRDILYVKQIDLTEVKRKLEGIKISVLCDVDNPLYGPNGAAYVFAPQKGARDLEISILDEGLKNISLVTGVDGEKPGFGAAGGLGFAFGGLLGGKLIKGADYVMNDIEFDKHIKDCDLFLTGEGKADKSSLNGKTAYSAAKRAGSYGVRTVVFVGQKDISAEEFGVESIIPITADYNVDYMSFEHSFENLKNEVRKFVLDNL